jgi:hypothetical protein
LQCRCARCSNNWSTCVPLLAYHFKRPADDATQDV